MRLLITSLATVALICTQAQAQAYDAYVIGEVADITSTSDGLLIRMKDNIQPTQCTHPYGWMLIPNASEAMISVVLSYWMAGRKLATVAVDSSTAASCKVIQYDPEG